jgi:hypothetical protein
MHWLTSRELWLYSVVPKADLTVRTHMAVKRLDRIVDRIKGGEQVGHNDHR